jgi:hypothetical protein
MHLRNVNREEWRNVLNAEVKRWSALSCSQLGAKTARLTGKAVEEALSVLRDRIQAVNNDKNSESTVSEAVAFGDFLSQDARVQPGEVSIRLTP